MPPSIVQTGTSAGKSYRRERLSTVDLHVLTSLYQLFLCCKYNLPFLNNKQPYEEVNGTEPFPLVSIPWPVL